MKNFLSLFAVFLFSYGLTAMEDEKIYLDIGGYEIKTTRSTIELSGVEYFKTLISGKFKKHEGCIFIDRPQAEGKLLDYFIRTFSLPKNIDENVVKTASDFFQIEAMKVYLKNQPKIKRKSLQIFVKTITGKTVVLNVYEDTTIAEIKEMLVGPFTSPTKEMTLIWAGRTLHDHNTLKQREIPKESTLHLVKAMYGD